MNPITTARAELKAELEAAEWIVYSTPPEHATAPAVVMQTPDPYLTPGASFSEWQVFLDLVVLGRNGTPDDSAAAVEDLFLRLLRTLPEEWAVDTRRGVSGLFMAALGGRKHPAVRVPVSAYIDTTQEGA